MMKIASLFAAVGVAAAQRGPCASTFVPGYTEAYCNTRVAPAGRIVKHNIQNILPSQPFINGNPKTWHDGTGKNAGGAGYTSDELEALYTSADTGFTYKLPSVTEYGTVKYNDWDPTSAEHCGMLCDLNSECHGFTFKFTICWLFGDSSSVQIQTGKDKWNTYFKSSSGIRAGTGGNPAGIFDDGSSIRANKAAMACDAYYTLGQPCTLDAVSGTSTSLSNNDFTSSSGFSTSLTLSDGSTWKGAAPSQFDSALTSFSSSGLTLGTRHDNGASGFFAAPDEDCGCDYETYATSMAVGASTGYGYYEATMSSTAGEFLNAFWFQGPESEINVLKVENGQATVSWYCFADQGNQVSQSEVISGVDISKDTTATLHYTAEQITVLIDGEIKYQVATPGCLQGKTMKPIFSVEVGDNLPSTNGVANGASFGSMNVKYFRKWTTETLVHNFQDGGVACVGDDSIHGAGFKFGGLYQGPVPAGKWRATCGQKLIGKRKFKTAGSMSIEACGAECRAYGGCVGFWWSLAENKKCRLYGDFVPQATEDFAAPTSRQGNVWMRLSSGVTEVPLSCDGASAGKFSGFTEKCFVAAGSYGPRASIDIDNDGKIDYGCPYDRSEFINENGVRVPKGCKLSQFTTAQGNFVGNVPGEPVQGYINAKRWIREGEHTKLWNRGGTPTALGEMTADLCVQLCAEECSCYAANWRFDKYHCWLMSKPNENQFRNQAKPPPTAPIRQLKQVIYIKNNPTPCDVASLKAQGLMSL